MSDTGKRLMPAAARRRQTALAWWAAAASWFLFIIAETWTPRPAVPAPDVSDWVLHAAGFAVLGALLQLAAAASWKNTLPARAVAIGLALAVLDELGQIPVPRRTASAGDLLADAVGLGIGAAGAAALIIVAGRSRAHR